MITLNDLALPATIAVLAIGLLLVVVWALSKPRAAVGRDGVAPGRASAAKRSRAVMMEMACNRCGHAMEIPAGKLERLTGVERALTVRSHPALAQREMAEYPCPHCEATHCFAREGSGWSWVGSNLYVPQASSAHCAECGSSITRIEAAPDNNDAFADAHEIDTGAAVRCSRCEALVCIACLLRKTHGYRPGASLVCPRCGRAAVGPRLEIR